MVWMDSFCCCSVRLGVIVASISSIITTLLVLLSFIFIDTELIENTSRYLLHDEAQLYDHNAITTWTLEKGIAYPKVISTATITGLSIYICTSVLAIFAAIKLIKYLLLPYIVTDFLRLMLLFVGHVIIMLSLKKKLNLGILIAASVTGGFCLLFIGYLWATSVALYQIIGVINTEHYKVLYAIDQRVSVQPNTYISKEKKEGNFKMNKTIKIPKQFSMTNTPSSYHLWYISELSYPKKPQGNVSSFSFNKFY